MQNIECSVIDWIIARLTAIRRALLQGDLTKKGRLIAEWAVCATDTWSKFAGMSAVEAVRSGAAKSVSSSLITSTTVGEENGCGPTAKHPKLVKDPQLEQLSLSVVGGDNSIVGSESVVSSEEIFGQVRVAHIASGRRNSTPAAADASVYCTVWVPLRVETQVMPTTPQELRLNSTSTFPCRVYAVAS